jgi:hypothetical protein
MLAIALRRSVEMGKLRRSFSGGERNIIGMLGEEIYQWIHPKAKRVDTWEFDFQDHGSSVQVKSRIIGGMPQPHYEFALERKDQLVDIYYFCMILDDFKKGWAIGSMAKEDLMRKGLEKKAGAPMPQGGFYVAGGWCVYVNQMTPAAFPPPDPIPVPEPPKGQLTLL